MRAAGLIFADSYDVELGELTRKRTLAAVPFGARYRVIDFTLSNMTNAGIRNVGIITNRYYDSLMNHVRGGSGWDLNRKQSSLMFLPPFASANGVSVYRHRLEAIQNNLTWLRNTPEKYVLISGSNYIGNIDFDRMLDFHIESGARMTCLYTRDLKGRQEGMEVQSFVMDQDGRITDCLFGVRKDENTVISANTFIMERQDLIRLAVETMREGKVSFRNDVQLPLTKEGSVWGYDAPEELLFMNNLSNYLKSNLDLLDGSVRHELFHTDGRPVVTSVKDSPPTRYGPHACAVNSLIADGAVIDGEVRNSIIFRGARVKRGAVVENSVVMQDTTIGENARIGYAVLDKNVQISEGRVLSGYITHPFYAKHREII